MPELALLKRAGIWTEQGTEETEYILKQNGAVAMQQPLFFVSYFVSYIYKIVSYFIEIQIFYQISVQNEPAHLRDLSKCAG